jgi:hypothetical protein
MKTPAAWIAALVLAVSLAIPASPAWSQTVTTSYGPFSINNTSGTQLSNPYYTFSVTTTGQLEVEYIASPGHCSNVIMRFLVDGSQVAATAPLTPGQSSGFVTLGPVSAGAHVVGLQAEGVVSGCNVGVLANWGGTANARTSVSVASTPQQIPAPGMIVTALFFVAGAWIALRRRLGR